MWPLTNVNSVDTLGACENAHVSERAVVCLNATAEIGTRDFGNHSQTAHPEWFAVYVRSNFEHLVNQVLEHKGVESFLPTYRMRRCWSDRIREVDFPLFPGYLFCHIEGHERGHILETRGVIGIVGVGNRPAAIAPEEIGAVRALVHSQLPLSKHPFLRVGQTVRIQHGPLAGLRGILVNMKSRCRLVVSITLLQRSIATEIDVAWISTT